MWDEDIVGLMVMHCDTTPVIVRWKRVYKGAGLAFVTFQTSKEADMVVRNIRWKRNTRDETQTVTATHAWYKARYHQHEMTPIPAFQPERVTRSMPPSPSVFAPAPQVAQAAKEDTPGGPARGEAGAPIMVAESAKARSESSNRTKVPASMSIPPWRHSQGRRRMETRSRSRRPRSRSIKRSSKGGNKKIDFDDGQTKFTLKWKDTSSASGR